MAITLVKSAKGASTLATTTASFSSATTAGNLIVLAFAADDYNGSPGAGWTQSTGMEQQTFHGGYLWWRISTGETNYSYTIGSDTKSAWIIAEFSGVDQSAPYDVSNGQLQQSSAFSYTTPSITPSTGNRLLVAMMGGSQSSTDLSTQSWGTWLNSFTGIDSSGTPGTSGTSDLVGIAYRLVTGNGSTGYSSGATASTITQSRSGLIISFKEASSGTSDGVASSSSTSTTSGVCRSTNAKVVSASGTGSASSVGRSTAETTGTSSGNGSATASSGAHFPSVGSSSGTGNASGVCEADAESTGSSSSVGSSSVAATAITEADFTSSGIGTVTGKPENLIPMSFEDPMFTGMTEVTSPVTVNAGDDLSHYSIVEQTGEPSITLNGNNVVSYCRADSRECVRITNGDFLIEKCYFESLGSIPDDDHADTIQAYSPGTRDANVVIRQTYIKAYLDAATAGYFTADDWDGSITLEDVIFDGGPWGWIVKCDPGCHINVSLKNVYFVGPFGNEGGPYYIQDVDTGTHTVLQWENVREATIVDGELIPGDFLDNPDAGTISGTASASGIGSVSSVGISTASSTSSSSGAGSAFGISSSTAESEGSSEGASESFGVNGSTLDTTAETNGVSDVFGVCSSTAETTGSISGISLASGESTSSSVEEREGTASGSSASTVIGEALNSSNFTESCSSEANSVGSSTAESIGSGEASSTVSGVGNSTAESEGLIEASSTVTGVGNSTAESIGSGEASSTVTGIGSGDGSSIASTTGTSSVSGVGSSTAESEGSIETESDSNGFGNAINLRIVSSQGSSSVSGITQSILNIDGVSSGSSIVAAVSASIGSSTATALGNSSAVGFTDDVNFVDGDGSSESVSTVEGVVENIIFETSTANSSGTSQARAYQIMPPDEFITIFKQASRKRVVILY